MWCCITTEDQCIYKGDNVICNGTALSLSDQCHDEYYDGPSCNYHPLDEDRCSLYDIPGVYRSYLDLCQDNRYVQHCKEDSSKKFVTKVCFLFSTCVDETLLCKGIPLCENKNDLKACKMNLPSMDWNPIYLLSTCTPDMLIDHPKYIMPYGQTIVSKLIADNSHFYCLNRGDTNPFLSNGADVDSKTWTQWVNTDCNEDTFRRCLGLRPDICIDPISKYILIIII